MARQAIAWRHGANCPACHLAGSKGLKAEARDIEVELGGRCYVIASVPVYVCNGRCNGAWHPHPEWGDGSKRSHRLYAAAWTQHRAWFLELKLWCERCLPGRYTPATEAHHRIYRSQGGGDEVENLEALCAACHGAEHSQRRGR